MSWRTVVISNRAKIELKLDYLVVRNENDIKKVHLSEVGVLIIENTAVSITACLLAELTVRKIKVIFCDGRRNPISELVPYYGCHDSSQKLRQQMGWDQNIKDAVWTEIVTEKIRKQRDCLRLISKEEYAMLQGYIEEMEFRDETNREGHAAKVYFNAMFGKEFTRSEDIAINVALNYGYSIILSAFNREVVANGYLTQLGLFHRNMFNQFNLSSDLMEPYRPLVDYKVYNMELEDELSHENKLELVNILNDEVVIDNKTQTLSNAIRIYCKSVFDALNEQDVSLLRFYRNEL